MRPPFSMMAFTVLYTRTLSLDIPDDQNRHQNDDPEDPDK